MTKPRAKEPRSLIDFSVVALNGDHRVGFNTTLSRRVRLFLLAATLAVFLDSSAGLVERLIAWIELLGKHVP